MSDSRTAATWRRDAPARAISRACTRRACTLPSTQSADDLTFTAALPPAFLARAHAFAARGDCSWDGRCSPQFAPFGFNGSPIRRTPTSNRRSRARGACRDLPPERARSAVDRTTSGVLCANRRRHAQRTPLRTCWTRRLTSRRRAAVTRRVASDGHRWRAAATSPAPTGTSVTSRRIC